MCTCETDAMGNQWAAGKPEQQTEKAEIQVLPGVFIEENSTYSRDSWSDVF